jgi:ribosome-binding protein 1
LKELQKDVKQLREKNEQLSSELAASTERPAVEGRENGIEEKMQKNNIQLVESTNLYVQAFLNAYVLNEIILFPLLSVQ